MLKIEEMEQKITVLESEINSLKVGMDTLIDKVKEAMKVMAETIGGNQEDMNGVLQEYDNRITALEHPLIKPGGGILQ